MTSLSSRRRRQKAAPPTVGTEKWFRLRVIMQLLLSRSRKQDNGWSWTLVSGSADRPQAKFVRGRNGLYSLVLWGKQVD